VLNPDATDAIYFVLRPGNSGAHEFSSNAAAHDVAVERYRIGLHNHQVR
jgi:cell division protein YceG involved in septum cleavage